jgi:hypothetical protein
MAEVKKLRERSQWLEPSRRQILSDQRREETMMTQTMRALTHLLIKMATML